MKSPILAGDEYVEYASRWDIGATGAHTKVAGVPGSGFASVARSALGKYTITFQRGVATGPLLECRIQHSPVTTTAPLVAFPTKGDYTPETNAAQATLKYETWDLDTPALTELPSGDQVTIVARFLKTKGT